MRCRKCFVYGSFVNEMVYENVYQNHRELYKDVLKR